MTTAVDVVLYFRCQPATLSCYPYLHPVEWQSIVPPQGIRDCKVTLALRNFRNAADATLLHDSSPKLSPPVAVWPFSSYIRRKPQERPSFAKSPVQFAPVPLPCRRGGRCGTCVWARSCCGAGPRSHGHPCLQPGTCSTTARWWAALLLTSRARCPGAGHTRHLEPRWLVGQCMLRVRYLVGIILIWTMGRSVCNDGKQNILWYSLVLCFAHIALRSKLRNQ